MVEHSMVVFGALTIFTLLMIKTDMFNGEMDAMGPHPRRGPHSKPKPEAK